MCGPGHATDTPLDVELLDYCNRVAADSESLDVTPLSDGFDDVDLEARLESLGYLCGGRGTATRRHGPPGPRK